MQDEVELLRKAGIDARLLDSGCCAERVLAPAVRAAPPDTLAPSPCASLARVR